MLCRFKTLFCRFDFNKDIRNSSCNGHRPIGDRMKTPFLSWLFAVILGVGVLPSLALAGAESGGGGNAVVCRSPDTKKIVSAELLDLFEGRQEMGFTYSKKPAD